MGRHAPEQKDAHSPDPFPRAAFPLRNLRNALAASPPARGVGQAPLPRRSGPPQELSDSSGGE
jgi:hypothetical protein